MELITRASSGIESVYLVGSADTSMDALSDVLGAINYLRSKGLPLSVGTYSKRDGGIRIPLAMRCDSLGTQAKSKQAVSEMLDNCHILWKTVRPRASSPESIRIAEKIDATRADRQLTLADVTPVRASEDPFSGLIGMDEQIALVRRLANAFKAYGRSSIGSPHMLFLGEPGLGKTELAFRTADYLKREGLISGGFTKVSAPELIGEYVGSTPHRVSEAFHAAMGGLLFIDEAYSLVDGAGNEYGTEAVNTLTECLDSLRKDVIVIAAGYPDKMRHFLSSTNPGLRERFGFTVRFSQYSPLELSEIYKSFAQKRGFALDIFDEDLREECEELTNYEGFAGARTMRLLFDESVLAAAESHPAERVINNRDFAVAVARGARKSPTMRVLGFA